MDPKWLCEGKLKGTKRVERELRGDGFLRLIRGKFTKDSPPTPLPELNLRPYTWDSHFVAMRKFLGFATDDTMVKEAEKLGTSLSLSPWANSTTTTDYTYSIAQYDPPFHIFSILNEVWVDVDASIFAGKATF
ncbi:MLP-like protein 28-like [Hibiscus syriacus]|uniref:MLP-like protein 28-like n=1 Tax=Hibiscus syriacus TaxID=106335 RepID=A0A6A2YQB3_HIBSY|nr:MLP-like protein 28-like [Hibiscus syriacus]